MRPNLEDRLTELESVVTYQQKMLSELNEVLIDVQRRLDHMPRDIARLSQEIAVTRELTTERRRPEDEIPPHY
jgi:uncharacterized coiled-coil protein SlyX